MEAAIIEDEKPSARKLSRMLEKLDIKVVATLHSVEEALQWFRQNPHPEMLFVDIQLSDGLSFEIFENEKINAACIFTTAYDEYALKAFKLNSVDYLLKPIDDEELEAAIKKFRENFASAEKNIDLSRLREFLSPAKQYKSRFSIQVGQHLKIFETEDVECFYSENKATYLHNKDGRSYLLDNSLEHLETELDPKQFFRINRKCIVNLKAIKDIVSYTNSRLQLKLYGFNEFDLIVSRERVKEFKEWLG